MGPVERLQLLRELLDYVRMLPQKACFGEGTVRHTCAGELPKNESEVDDFIRKRTLLWRETWVIPKIEAMIKDDAKKIKKRRERGRVPNIFEMGKRR